MEQQDAQAEQAGKEITPVSFSPRNEKRKKKTTENQGKVRERGLNVLLFCLCRVCKSWLSQHFHLLSAFIRGLVAFA